ncbi:hypothetical protein ACFSCV_14255 [Methylopila henanensis]|uniref:Uncharacterized protein n=1 Tax=Methylopila henanensis TaxID=873516 RepID=A0ABW4K8Y7_9HYPH
MADDVPSATASARPASSGPLREALRRARIEAAERSDVVIDLRQAEIARLEILRDALAPVFADVPPEVDLFDVGLVPGDRPRLFVDMVSFVEMGRDRKVYRFLRDGRHGRSVAAESEQVEPIVAAVTDYVARRLVERERLLAQDDHEHRPSPDPAPVAAAPAAEPAPQPYAPTADVAPAPAPVAARPARSRWVRALAVLGAFVIGGTVGAIVVVALMVAAAKGVLPGIG